MHVRTRKSSGVSDALAARTKGREGKGGGHSIMQFMAEKL